METAAAGLQLFVLFLRLREEGASSFRRSRKNNQAKKVKAKGHLRNGVGQVQGHEMNCSECDLERRAGAGSTVH